MSGLKTIRRRIVSVRNTKQITRAMKLVSAAKLRRAQDAAVNGRAFVQHLSRIMSTILGDLPADFSHPLLEQRSTVRSRCIVVIAGERGLCGAYNSNVTKAVLAELAQKSADGGAIETDVIALGRRSVSSGRRLGWTVVQAYEGLAEDASRWPASAIAAHVIDGFTTKRYDEVVLIYTEFVSAMSQRVARETLLPLSARALSGTAEVSGTPGLTKYSPGPVATFDLLLPMLINSKLLQAGMESKASEHAARMTAMDSATSNADELIGKLRLFYNRARQSAITKELLDIIGGAEAIG